jgi:uncharacterized coiled-coil protein SlyX
MARRNPQDTITALREELAERDEQIETLEDKLDRVTGRVARASSILGIQDIEQDDEEGNAEGESCEHCDGEGCDECEPDENE